MKIPVGIQTVEYRAIKKKPTSDTSIIHTCAWLLPNLIFSKKYEHRKKVFILSWLYHDSTIFQVCVHFNPRHTTSRNIARQFKLVQASGYWPEHEAVRLNFWSLRVFRLYLIYGIYWNVYHYITHWHTKSYSSPVINLIKSNNKINYI